MPPREGLPDDYSVDCGKTIRAWFLRNGWSLRVPRTWVDETGAQGPYDSQISNLWNHNLSPKPPFFVSLARFNEYVAKRDFSNITNEKLKGSLRNSEPLCKDNGEPYVAADFFNLYIGALKPPEWVLEPQPISDEEAKKLGDKAMELFENHARAQMIPPKRAWESLEPFLNDLDKNQIAKLRDVLSGWKK